MYIHVSKPQESMYHTLKHVFFSSTHNDLTLRCGLDYSMLTFFWWWHHNCGPSHPLTHGGLVSYPAHMFYMGQYSWSWLNVCSSHQRWTPQYAFQPLETDVILLRLSLGLRPLIRENVSSLWQPVTPRGEGKKKTTTYNPFYFLYGWLWVCVQASVRLCATAVSCDVAMTTDYAARDRLRVQKKTPKNTASGS